jgi:hypothetical protein
MRRNSAVPALVVAAVLLAGAVLSAQSIRVTPLVREGRLLVSFDLTDAMTSDLREAIRSGLPTGFTCEVQLRRAASIWFDRTLAAASVAVQVRYDNLTRRYLVSLVQDGRVEWTRPTDREEVAEAWMTEFRQLALFNTSRLEPNGEYYVRVRVTARPRNGWFLLPWDRHALSGRAKFTFIP